MPQDGRQREDNFASLRIVRAHTSEPETILLRAVVNGQLAPFQKFLPFARGESHRIAVALQVEEQLGSVFVLPFARVNGAPAQTDDDREMLDSHRALVFTRAAGGALERRFLGNMARQQRLGSGLPVIVQLVPYAARVLLGVQSLARIVRRAVLGTAPALDAGVGLQGHKPGNILSRVQSEIFVVRKWRNFAEPVAFEKNRRRTQDQMQV